MDIFFLSLVFNKGSNLVCFFVTVQGMRRGSSGGSLDSGVVSLFITSNLRINKV